MSKKYISVFIPTFNGEKYIGECIDAVLRQEMPNNYLLELIIIDSGSTDNTLEIIDQYINLLTLIQIPNEEFSHGGTRDKAARIAKGEYILFLTQDATPTNYRWIKNMIEPFFISDRVGCVFGRQVPRPNAAVTIKREVSSVFGSLGNADSIVIYRSRSVTDNLKINDINSFFSDVNSAVRRDLLVGNVPFRHVKYAEDQALAEDMQNNGYLKAYTPKGEVWHSNEYTAGEYLRRKFDEYIGLIETTGLEIAPSIKSLLLGWIKPTLADYKFIIRDGEYSLKRKLYSFTQSPLYNIGLQRGKYLAAKYSNNKIVKDKISLENKTRS